MRSKQSKSIKVSAPAKINLFLEVLKKRPDGYHAIDTIFQTVSLSDILRISTRPSGIKLHISGRFKRGIPSGKGNIVYKAAQEVLTVLHEKRGVIVSLTKNIPAGAGLGGGSSDAAAVIRSLPKLLGRELSHAGSHAIARRLGADVPFFLSRGCARARGIGDIIQPVRNNASFWIVLVYPGIHCSTADVYKNLRRIKILTNKENIHSIVKSLRTGKKLREWGRFLFNRLEEGVPEYYPDLNRLRDRLRRSGAEYVLMSGSGSSFCAFVSTHAKAVVIKNYIQRNNRLKNGTVWIVRPAAN